MSEQCSEIIFERSFLSWLCRVEPSWHLLASRLSWGNNRALVRLTLSSERWRRQGLLQEFERIRNEIKADNANALLWEPILRKIQPGFITECENAVRWSREMATRFLKENMFAGSKAATPKINKIISHLTEKQTTITHGRHIGLEEAQTLFGDRIVTLESDQKLQDLVLTVHHASIVTLQATPAFKMIENHTGRAFMQQAQQVMQVGKS